MKWVYMSKSLLVNNSLQKGFKIVINYQFVENGNESGCRYLSNHTIIKVEQNSLLRRS